MKRITHRKLHPGFRKSSPAYDDLDFLIGAWSAKEADEFDRGLRSVRRIRFREAGAAWDRKAGRPARR
jgi:hypothetical protein